MTTRGSNVTVDADPAWVLVAPPDFAPHLENVVTLYDVVYGRAARLADPSLAVTATSRVSFTRDIYPLLRRVSMLRWVSGVAADKRLAHGENGPNDFVGQVALLSKNTMDASQPRHRIFNALRNPKDRSGNDAQGTGREEKNVRGPSVTETQYKRMERWLRAASTRTGPARSPPRSRSINCRRPNGLTRWIVPPLRPA